jgi:hypothetical protein
VVAVRLNQESISSQRASGAIPIIVEGFEWLKGESREIGLQSLVGKILCTAHNNLLSPLDAEARRLFTALDKIAALIDVRQKLKARPVWKVIEYRVSASLIERWAAKTIIGTFCVAAKRDVWKATGTPANQPPVPAVEAIFGHAAFPQPMGLYVALSVSEKRSYQDFVGVAPFRLEGQLVGAVMDFKIFRWVMWLYDQPPSRFTFQPESGSTFGPDHQKLVRLGTQRFMNHGVLSQRLCFVR